MAQGIPTTYAGVRFRSRLEARWAAFFDLVGWSWEYEPVDLAGWIPDFRLDSWNGEPGLLVEVKPLERLGYGEEDDALARIDGSGWVDPVLLVGDGPRLRCDDSLAVADAFGVAYGRVLWDWECDPVPEDGPFRRGLAGVQVGSVGGVPDLHAFTPGNGFASWVFFLAGSPPVADERSLWVAAGNVVQWRAR